MKPQLTDTSHSPSRLAGWFITKVVLMVTMGSVKFHTGEPSDTKSQWLKVQLY